jgi:hypothetical protein
MIIETIVVVIVVVRHGVAFGLLVIELLQHLKY